MSSFVGTDFSDYFSDFYACQFSFLALLSLNFLCGTMLFSAFVLLVGRQEGIQPVNSVS